MVVRGDGVTVGPALAADPSSDVGVLAARRRFGGIDVPATIAGALAGIGTAALVGGVLSRGGDAGYTDAADGARTLTSMGRFGALAALLVAFAVGGWVAGRMARYDGARNGLVAAAWLALITLGAAALYPRLGLPDWASNDAVTPAALAAGAAALAVLFLAAWASGRAGEHYHDQADALIARTRRGGVARLNRATAR